MYLKCSESEGNLRVYLTLSIIVKGSHESVQASFFVRSFLISPNCITFNVIYLKFDCTENNTALVTKILSSLSRTKIFDI